MLDIANLLKDTGPYFIAAVVILILGRQYLIVRAKEADAKVIAAEHDKEKAKYQSEAEIRRDARDEKIAMELAQYRAQQTASVAASDKALQQNTEIAGQTVAALAGLTGQQATAQNTITEAVGKSEVNVISHVESSKDEVLAALSLLGQFNTEVFKPVAAQPPDLVAMRKILEAALKSVAAVQSRQEVSIAANTTAIADAATALAAGPPASASVPPEVVVADISPVAIESIIQAVAPKAATDDGEDMEDVA